jgi:GTPase involved in cell partitioning and DNA repair
MKFIDEAKIFITAGNGGKGCVMVVRYTSSERKTFKPYTI